MAISTRWHEPSCGTPQVVVDGNVPECRSCGSNASALLRRAAEEPAPSYSGINLPPEAPIGQMDLWWPPCMPYTRNGVRRPRPAVSSGDAASLTPQASASKSSLSEIYFSSLNSDHFRLLYLSGAHDIDSPIHGSLVKYSRKNCPEYETTSYTWGGEDGDATPCKPAYFGAFWDVLFLTRNCWSLLQYLRPTIGTRVVWVDAICINQNNIPERGAQVASMPQIYRNCMRVVIYPGDHLVCREQHKLRQRVRQDGMAEDGDTDSVGDSRFDIWGSVLQGRYITRVWIIQELILAPHSILALGHHDLDLTNNLLYRVSKKKIGRQWLEYMGQDHKLRHTTLLEGLRMTSGNQATDPRDRIFGILGILGGNLTYSRIVPDYSLSMRDCVIGAVGLTLITSKEIWPLLHVKTSNSPLNYPSWVPNLDNLAVTSEVESPDTATERVASLELSTVRREEREQWGTVIHIHHVHHAHYVDRTRSKETQSLKIASELLVSWFQDASIDSRCGALTLRLVHLFDKPHSVMIQRFESMDYIHFVVEGPSAVARLMSTQLPQMPAQPYHIFLAFGAPALDNRWTNDLPGMQKSRVNDTYLVFASEAETSDTFRLMGCCPLRGASFLSASPPPPTAPWALHLDEETRLGRRNIQSLFETLQHTIEYNALEPRQQVLNEYREIRFCEALPPELENPDMNDRQRREMWLEFNDVYYLEGFRDNPISEAMLFDMIVPGKGAVAPGFLHLSLSAARAGEAATVTEEFTRAYSACLQSTASDLNPVIDEGYVWFTLLDEDSLGHYWDSLLKHISDVVQIGGGRDESSPWRPWDILFPHWFDLQIPGIHRTDFDGVTCMDVSCKMIGWRLGRSDPIHCKLHGDWDPQGHIGLHYWLPCAAEPMNLQMPVRARMPLGKVVEAIRRTRLNWLHRYLLAFSDKLAVDVETLLERGPQPEDRNVFAHDWPKSLADELGFVWREESVTFV